MRQDPTDEEPTKRIHREWHISAEGRKFLQLVAQNNENMGALLSADCIEDCERVDRT
jgi:hypothetical protein